MAECKQQLLLAAYHDDELGEVERAAMEEHLRQCPTCAAELEALRAASNPLRQLRREHLGNDALDGLHQRFDEATDDSRFLRFGMTLGVIAASVLLVGLAWLKVLPASSGGTQPLGPVVVSPVALQPWERTAITLRPDPSTLPMSQNDPTNRLAVADWMVDGLKTRSEP